MDSSNPWTSERYRVDTPERIDLEYDVAGLGSRLVAALADTAIVTIVAVLVMVLGTMGLAVVTGLAAGVLDADLDYGQAATWAFAGAIVLAFVVIWGYYVFFELVWHGQSPGKRWAGLRVIKDGGYPIGFVDSAIRNLVRLVDFLPFNYLVGAMAMLIDRRSRRLGDFAAGTLVVKERRDLTIAALELGRELGRDTSLPVPPADPAADSPIPELHRLTPSDQTLLREYLLRRSSLAGPAATELAAHLAAAFALKLGHDLAAEPPELFLARLARQAGSRQ